MAKTTEAFDGSDAVRSARPLKYVQTVTFDKPLSLELGETLSGVTVAYETYGRLNDACDNAVFICHALSGDSHVAAHDASDDPGWWDIAVGPGKCIDTDKYFVVCANILGGCRGTTGPNSLNPATGKQYGADFPTITIGDMVNAHVRLLRHLGVQCVLAAVGGSMGGHQVLDWAVRHPDTLKAAVAMATSARLSSQALAFDIVSRNAILHDPNFNGGQYYDSPHGPDVGLAIARMIGHITYLSREAMREKFEADRHRPRDVPVEFEKEFSVGSYLGYQGAKFVERFDANSYIRLSMAMDLFDLGDSALKLAPVFQPTRCRWLVVSFTSDWLFSPEESRQIVDALASIGKPVSYCNVKSSCGHDAFLLADDLRTYGGLLEAFLADARGEPLVKASSEDRSARNSVSIFHPRRLDYDRIVDLVAPATSVLDVGCGDGGLLASLHRHGNSPLMGVEIDQDAVLTCVRQGFNVIHSDLAAGLPAFADGQFDYVVLSRTLQAVYDVQAALHEILRVGRRAIVSFPNFAYHKLRNMLCEQGKAPEAGVLQNRWYNSPNIRFFSITDFEEFCQAKGVTVHRRVALDTESNEEVTDDPNLNADLAIFVLSK